MACICFSFSWLDLSYSFNFLFRIERLDSYSRVALMCLVSRVSSWFFGVVNSENWAYLALYSMVSSVCFLVEKWVLLWNVVSFYDLSLDFSLFSRNLLTSSPSKMLIIWATLWIILLMYRLALGCCYVVFHLPYFILECSDGLFIWLTMFHSYFVRWGS